MRAVCIDFETANRYSGSICAVGIAVIENGAIVHHEHRLVKPHQKYFYFEPINIRIHGIREADVIDAPEFDAVFADLRPLLGSSTLVAHNAAFDISVLRSALDLYDIAYPSVHYLCTYKTAVRTWSDLDNYKLNTVCNFIGHKFKHHNAEEDAVACGKILIAALQEKAVSTIEELTTKIGMKLGRLYERGYTSCSIASQRKKAIER